MTNESTVNLETYSKIVKLRETLADNLTIQPECESMEVLSKISSIISDIDNVSDEELKNVLDLVEKELLKDK